MPHHWDWLMGFTPLGVVPYMVFIWDVLKATGSPRLFRYAAVIVLGLVGLTIPVWPWITAVIWISVVNATAVTLQYVRTKSEWGEAREKLRVLTLGLCDEVSQAGVLPFPRDLPDNVIQHAVISKSERTDMLLPRYWWAAVHVTMKDDEVRGNSAYVGAGWLLDPSRWINHNTVRKIAYQQPRRVKRARVGELDWDLRALGKPARVKSKEPEKEKES